MANCRSRTFSFRGNRCAGAEGAARERSWSPLGTLCDRSCCTSAESTSSGAATAAGQDACDASGKYDASTGACAAAHGSAGPGSAPRAAAPCAGEAPPRALGAAARGGRAAAGPMLGTERLRPLAARAPLVGAKVEVVPSAFCVTMRPSKRFMKLELIAGRQSGRRPPIRRARRRHGGKRARGARRAAGRAANEEKAGSWGPVPVPVSLCLLASASLGSTGTHALRAGPPPWRLEVGNLNWDILRMESGKFCEALVRVSDGAPT